MNRSARTALALMLVIGGTNTTSAQEPNSRDAPGPGAPAQSPPRDDRRAQYPAFLANSFVGLDVGYIGYPFSNRQVEPGHRVGSVTIPHVAARAVLFGHHFGRYLSVQGSYMRPVNYVRYSGVDGAGSGTVWMHFGTVTAQGRFPLSSRVSLYGEVGPALTSRKGFPDEGPPVVQDAHFWSPLIGGGLEYHAGPAWDLLMGASHIPQRSDQQGPGTTFASAAFRYTMRSLPAERVAETLAAGYLFPEHLVQVGYATDAFGFGLNNFVSKTVPIFWGGTVEVKRSHLSVSYQRNLFHTKKRFAFDVGVSAGQWRSGQRAEVFRTFSVFPLLRFTVLRTSRADMYAAYSVAGPSYISKTVIDDLDMGGRFTFQDFMALGFFLGRGRHVNVELNVNHYSNGNILRANAGVKVPLAIKAGYAF
jgi:hypothetical protein